MTVTEARDLTNRLWDVVKGEEDHMYCYYVGDQVELYIESGRPGDWVIPVKVERQVRTLADKYSKELEASSGSEDREHYGTCPRWQWISLSGGTPIGAPDCTCDLFDEESSSRGEGEERE
jgi:hypothetical protein